MAHVLAQVHQIVHVGGTPCLIYRGRCLLQAVAIVTPVPRTDPLVALWIYDEDTIGAEPQAGAHYVRRLNGKCHALDVGLATQYDHGISAVLRLGSHGPAAPMHWLTFTISFTPDPVTCVAAEVT